jgi:hypothetical protein
MPETTAQRPVISVETRHITPTDVGLPSLAVQITRLVDSYMLWVGVTEDGPEEVAQAPLKGSLARDWACAMPTINVRAVHAVGGHDLKIHSHTYTFLAFWCFIAATARAGDVSVPQLELGRRVGHVPTPR